MSNFECPHCGMVNIDCGKDEYKTPREIELEQKNEELKRQCESLKGLITVGGKQQFALTQRVDELEQKLEKIKEIAKENCSCTRCEDLNCCDGCQDENYRRILQIIEE